MTAREVLDQIEQRAKAGPVSNWDARGGDEPHHRVIERQIRFYRQMTADQLGLVDALRAVLQIMDDDDTPFQVAGYVEDAIAEALGADA